MIWQRDFESVSTGRVSGITYMSQGTWDHISYTQTAMSVVKSIKTERFETQQHNEIVRLMRPMALDLILLKAPPKYERSTPKKDRLWACKLLRVVMAHHTKECICSREEPLSFLLNV